MDIQPIRFSKGQTIIEEGKVLENLIILQTGEVDIQKNGKSIAMIDERNTFLGEISFLLGIPTTANVIANGYCNILKIPATNAEEFFSKFPGLALKMCKVLAQRLNETTQKLNK